MPRDLSCGKFLSQYFWIPPANFTSTLKQFHVYLCAPLQIILESKWLNFRNIVHEPIIHLKVKYSKLFYKPYNWTKLLCSYICPQSTLLTSVFDIISSAWLPELVKIVVIVDIRVEKIGFTVTFTGISSRPAIRWHLAGVSN